MNDLSKKSTDIARTPRAAVTGGRVDRALSDEERLQIFREATYQSALPELPPIPGFHVCWLTTENGRDPIQSRLRMGYTLCKPEDFPGLYNETVTTGEWAGFVGFKEMIAAKLPLNLYQQYMAIAHHERPANEEAKLAETARSMREQARRQGADLAIGEGIDDIPDAEDVPTPDFTEHDRRDASVN